MKRKIFKYIKVLMSVVLILSLIAPSYASLSASDGSAFVTKAEFDSALADFNARLTTFEAGINSKIDSQVTSYLDRNGIWNGKVQALYSTYAGVVGYKRMGGNNNFRYISFGPSGIEYRNGTSPTYYWPSKLTGNENYMIKDIQKTGLLYLIYDIYLTSDILTGAFKKSTPQWAAGLIVEGTTGNIVGDQVSFCVGAIYEVYQENPAGGRELLFAISRILLCPIPGRITAYQEQNQSALFFVKKGSNLIVKPINNSYNSNVNIMDDIAYNIKWISAAIY